MAKEEQGEAKAGNDMNRKGQRRKGIAKQAWNGAGMDWLCSGYAAIRQAKQR